MHIGPLVADSYKNSLSDLLLGGIEGLFNQDLYDAEESLVDCELEKLWYWDFERLSKSQKDLLLRAKDPKPTLVLHKQIVLMAEMLNLYLNEALLYTLCQASELAFEAQGRGTSHTWQTGVWIHTYLDNRKIPKDNCGTTNNSLLTNESFAQSIQLYLLERSKGGYLSAKDIIEFVVMEEMQEKI